MTDRQPRSWSDAEDPAPAADAGRRTLAGTDCGTEKLRWTNHTHTSAYSLDRTFQAQRHSALAINCRWDSKRIGDCGVYFLRNCRFWLAFGRSGADGGVMPGLADLGAKGQQQREGLPRMPSPGWGPMRLEGMSGYTSNAGPRRVDMNRRAVLVALNDAVLGTLVGLLAIFLRFGDSHALATGVPYTVLALLLGPAWVAAMWFGGSYDTRYMVSGAEEYRRVANAGIWLLAAVGFAAFAFQANVSRGLVAIALPTLTVATLLGRAVARLLLRRLIRSDAAVHRTVVVGGSQDAADLALHMKRAAHAGFTVVGICTPEQQSTDGNAMEAAKSAGVPIRGPNDLAAGVQGLDADTLAVTHANSFGVGQLRRLSWALEGTGIALLVAPSLTDVAGPRIVVRPVQGLPLLHIEEPDFHGAKRMLKTVIDRLLGGAILLACTPLMLGTALAIKISGGPGPIFYRQVRVGRHGREFLIWKFRTMRLDADEQHKTLLEATGHDGVLFKLTVDPRVTRIGSVLRRYSLDELPQLFNVIGGSMSLVGPRPQRPFEVAQYGDEAKRRLLVKPGMTGLWQVSGRNTLTWDETVQLDLHYVENWSVTRDLLILIKTAWAVVRASGAY